MRSLDMMLMVMRNKNIFLALGRDAYTDMLSSACGKLLKGRCPAFTYLTTYYQLTFINASGQDQLM